MIDRRSQTDRHRLLAADQVLEGATLRDRFLTAFILRNVGFFASGVAAQREAAARCEAVCYPSSLGPDELDVDAVSFSVVQGGTPGGNGYEPIATVMIEDWFFTDGDDDM